MPFLSRKLPMLVVLVLSASLPSILAFAQVCSARNASTDPSIRATSASGWATPADGPGVAALKG
jgi:hypothetical protein